MYASKTTGIKLDEFPAFHLKETGYNAHTVGTTAVKHEIKEHIKK